MIEIKLTTGYVIRCKRYERIEHVVPALRLIKNSGKEEIIPDFLIAEIKE